MKRAYRVGDVRAAEEPLLAAGVPLMSQAAWALSHAVIQRLRREKLTIPGSRVLALVGAGNNGADALFAAANLARRGLAVTAVCHGSVHSQGLATAISSGVTILHNPDCSHVRAAAQAAETWLDGIAGIGSQGSLREPMATWVRELNLVRAQSPIEPYVIAVDIPSGVGVDDGTIPLDSRGNKGSVLSANETVTMGAAKRCLYLPPACHLAGTITQVPLGFEPLLPARPALAQLDDSDVRDLWIVPGVDDHKYTRGVIGVLAGSPTYPGAGILSVAGARATGAGMVRYAGSVESITTLYPDVVNTPGRVNAWVIGSGLDDLTEASKIFQHAVAASIPVILDATAIALIYSDDVPSTVVITPHEGELTELLQERGEHITRDQIHAAPARAARLAATLTGATVVLKGSVTVIAAPHGPLYAQGGAPGWLGTAGAGDVLGGVMGTLLAMYGQQIQTWGEGRGLPGQLAAAACYVHARAARIAARCDCEHSMNQKHVHSNRAANNAHNNTQPAAIARPYSAAYSRTLGNVVTPTHPTSTTRPATVGNPVTAYDVATAVPRALFEILNPGA